MRLVLYNDENSRSHLVPSFMDGTCHAHNGVGHGHFVRPLFHTGDGSEPLARVFALSDAAFSWRILGQPGVAQSVRAKQVSTPAHPEQIPGRGVFLVAVDVADLDITSCAAQSAVRFARRRPGVGAIAGHGRSLRGFLAPTTGYQQQQRLWHLSACNESDTVDPFFSNRSDGILSLSARNHVL
jgi:hypothetical protein